MDFLSWSNTELKERLENLPSFSADNQKHLSSPVDEEKNMVRPDVPVKIYLGKLKKIMQMISTQIIELDTNDKAAVLEKGFSLQKRKGQTQKSNQKNKKNDSKSRGKDKSVTTVVKSSEGCKVLKRKRFHNFTESVMAHEYLAYRRLDRVYHRACLRFPLLESSNDKPFIVLSLNGDLFLTGQVLRIVGLFLALANGLIDTDFVDCVFDEAYPHLISTPPALPLGMMAGEAYYMTWEGKFHYSLPFDFCRYIFLLFCLQFLNR
jgi:hypothetical protein